MRIKFTSSGHSHTVGNFAIGDIADVDETVARHFVDDARCAEYADTVQTPATKSAEPARKSKKGATQ